MIIETSNLTKKYSNKVTALNNVSLSIDTGIFGLLGRNGSGKTTLMRILTTLIEPTGGTASILGMDITPANKTQIKRSIGYLPQEFGFYKEFTFSEIMEYICIMRDFDKKTIGETLEKVNLYNERKKKYKELSGGMKRRVGLAQAILGNPPVLIVDEPTVGVDPEERIKIRKLLDEYAEKNTVLFSTHIIEDIEYICDKLAILDNGKLLYSGSIEDLLKSVQGKIYEARFNTKDELHKFEESHTVISFKRDDTQVRAIVICENDAEPSSIPYKPTLEEVYVYLTTIKGGK